MAEITIITSDRNWLESAALRQLESIAKYPGVLRVTGLPDLHAGRTPVGLAVVSAGHIYPYLIGNDIGCGMGLFKTGLLSRKFKLEKWENQLAQDRDYGSYPLANPFPEAAPFPNLGTLGGGNHFLEFQKVEKIIKPSDSPPGLDQGEVLLLVHTGSRGFGRNIMAEFSAETGYDLADPSAGRYLELHDQALLWARRNRFLAATKVMTYLGLGRQPEVLLDSPHNYLTRQGEVFIHRKGAVSALDGWGVIPGSRGSLTYVVRPTTDPEKLEKASWSLAHGAGRKWERGLCRGRLEKKYDREALRRTALKSRVVCHDLDLLFQEAPEAYKNIDAVVAALADHGLAEVVATLRPLLTFKG
jgi:release factor H-coupled RctB family protein